MKDVFLFCGYAVSWMNRGIDRFVDWHVRGYVPRHLTPRAMKRYGVWL